MNLRLRGACPRDFKRIETLVEQYKFNFDISHVKTLVVVEDLDTGNIVAVGSLVTILESMIVTDKDQSRKSRVEALKMLVSCADDEAGKMKYDSYHCFVTNDSISKIMKRKYDCVPTSAQEVLIRNL